MISRRTLLGTVSAGILTGITSSSLSSSHPNTGIPSEINKPDFIRTVSDDTISLEYTFPMRFGSQNIVKSQIDIPKQKYISETNNEDMYHNQLKNAVKDEFVTQEISTEFIPDYNTERVRKLLNFVQLIDYSRDKNSTDATNYSRHPVETLVDNVGDCKDKTILLYSILKNRGYTVGYVIYPQHIAPIVARDEVEEALSENIKSVVHTDVHEYIVLESTSFRYIGKSDYKKENIIYSYTEEENITVHNPEALTKQVQRMIDIPD